MRADLKIKAVAWKSGKEDVGIVLVENVEGKQRAYIGTTFRKLDLIDALMGTDPDDEIDDAEYIADWGARLTYKEAAGFFDESGLIKENYQESGDL